MKNILKLSIIASLFLIFNCSDEYLDLQPETDWNVENFYKNETEVKIALSGMYSMLASNNLFGDNLLMMDYGTDEGYASRAWIEDSPVNLYSHNGSTRDIELTYRSLYTLINLANLFLDKLNPTTFDDSVYQSYIGEAKFLRGLAYYHLTLWWNEVPLRTTPVVDQNSNHVAPSSVDVIYNQIISDLDHAAETLPLVSDSNYEVGRANAMAAHGLLAKVYLKMGGFPLNASDYKGENPYDKAAAHCKVIMDSGEHALNASYRDHFLNYIQNTFDTQETIFEIMFHDNTDLGIVTQGSIGTKNGLAFNNYIEINYPLARYEVAPSPILETISEPEDLRPSWNIPGYFYGKGNANVASPVKASYSLAWNYTIGKFRRWEPIYPDDIAASNNEDPAYVLLEDTNNPNRQTTGINLPILRYSDVLLMYAEAINATQGPTSEAVSALDLVRNRAGLDNLATFNPDAVTSQSNFFEEIVDERFRELCFEGHRKADLIRWGLLPQKIEELELSIIYHPSYQTMIDNGSKAPAGYLRCVNNFNPAIHLSLPYPVQEIQINNKLNQKEGW